MTKKDSERNKLYSNVKIQKLDPLSDKLSSAGFSGGASKGLKIKDTKKLLKEVKPIIDKKNKTYRSMKPGDSTKNLNKAQERVHVADEYRSYVNLRMKNKLPVEARKMLDEPFKKVLKIRKLTRDAFARRLIKKDN
jgi:hypothetical protein